jgi:hypothetical protein
LAHTTTNKPVESILFGRFLAEIVPQIANQIRSAGRFFSWFGNDQ